MATVESVCYRSLNYPLTKNSGDAGYDIRSSIEYTLQARSRSLIPTGLFLSMPQSVYAQIHPRSGLSIRGIDIGAGILDSCFRGELKILLINNSQLDFHISVGDRVAQLILHPLYTGSVVRVEHLDDSERGSKGFGSSGLQ
jgi:dUTP pyrophosphatase